MATESPTSPMDVMGGAVVVVVVDVVDDGSSPGVVVPAEVVGVSLVVGAITFLRVAGDTEYTASPTTLTISGVEENEIIDLGGGLLGAIATIYIYDDTNGDGAHAAGEPIVALSSILPLYLEGDPSSDLDDSWAGLQLYQDGSDPTVAALTAGVDTHSFTPVDSITFGGTAGTLTR